MLLASGDWLVWGLGDCGEAGDADVALPLAGCKVGMIFVRE